VPRPGADVRLVELLLLLAATGCDARQERSEQTRPTRASASASGKAPVSLAPRPAGTFDCGAAGCVQLHPRLPDTGEWLCAERDGVVWCSGGEGAAGVVSGPPDPKYRCGRRWRNASTERVCIDRHPDYPSPDLAYRCRFEQERRVARVCEPHSGAVPPPLAAQALPACFLDRDCPTGHCDRGSCSCSTDSDCLAGRCSSGACLGQLP
jgi:hypothetical protein